MNFVLFKKGVFMTHSELWGGICNLADSFNISCSHLAKISGLDPTTFNRSKHTTRHGQPRWLSTYSLACVLDATGLTLAQFAEFLPSDTHAHPKYKHFPKNETN